jgi:cytochrome b
MFHKPAAAGDVSLAAYIQALLQRKEDEVNDVSPLGAVMTFLYYTYIVIYAITSAIVGRYIDKVGAANTNNFAKGIVAVPDYPDKYINVHPAVKNIAGVQFTVIAIVMILATLSPKGSLSFNPKSLYGETLRHDDTSEENLVDEETGVVVGE